MKMQTLLLRHATTISGISFIVGNALLIVKNLHGGHAPNDAEQAAGAFLLLASTFFILTNRYPQMKPLAGIATLGGAIVLGCSGFGMPGQNALIFGSAMMALQSFTLIFENALHGFAQRSAGETLFSPLARYPLLTSTACGFIFATLPMIYAAMMRLDFGMLVACAFWKIGDCGLIASDRNVKKLLERRLQPSASHIS